MSRVLQIAAVLLLLSGAVAADVLIVESAVPAGPDALNAALQAAQPGDFVLVKPGDYVDDALDLVVIDRGVTLVADSDEPIWLPAVLVHDVPLGETVVLRGFRIGPVDATSFDHGRALTVRDCSGAVWVEDCLFLTPGLPATDFLPGEPGVIVDRSTNVLFTASSIVGGDGPDAILVPLTLPANLGGAGMTVDDSRVALHEVTVLGGEGGTGLAVGGLLAGGEGLVVRGASDVMLSGSLLTGADAGASPGGVPARPGLRLAGAAPIVRRLDTAIDGGLDAGGVPVAAIENAGGTLDEIPGTARGLSIPGLVRVGTPSSLILTGEPGDVGAVLIAFGGDWLPLPGKAGVLTLGSPMLGPFVLGPTDATGTLVVPFTASMLGVPGSLAETYLLQGVVWTAGGEARLGESTSLLLLGGGF